MLGLELIKTFRKK